MGFRIYGLGFMGQGPGFTVKGVGLRSGIQDTRVRV